MKTLEERALAYSEQVVNDTPFDVINGKVCVWQEDKDICEVAIQAYIAGALEQRDMDIDIEKFEKWYCKKKCYRKKECLIPMNLCYRLGQIVKEIENI